MGFDTYHVNKEIFDGIKKMKFEDKEYNVPIRYDELLTAQYGDYMKLPPKEKQVSHHSFVAYKLIDDEK